MTPERIKIGNPPDYRMIAGKQIYFHQASIKIKLTNGNTYSLSLSNASMFELVKMLKEKLLVIGSTTQIEMVLPESGDVTGTLSTKAGDASIQYRRNSRLSERQGGFLNDVFARKFD